MFHISIKSLILSETLRPTANESFYTCIIVRKYDNPKSDSIKKITGLHYLILFTNKVSRKLSNDTRWNWNIFVKECIFLKMLSSFLFTVTFCMCLNGYIVTYLLTFSNARLISIAPWVGVVRTSTMPPRNSSVKPGQDVSANWNAFNNSSTICVGSADWPLSS